MMAAAPSPSGSHFLADAWYFTKDELRHSPSVRDGYSSAQETKERRAVCAFMQESGKKLQLPQLSIATGIVFFHRFFALHSFKDYDGYIIGISCLFLAAKVEETPKKLRDVLIHSDAVRNEGLGKEPLSPTSQDYSWLKDQVLQGERAVLQTMAFELTIDHPYKYVLNYVKLFRGNLNDKETKEVTWNFVNDSLRTTLCLEYRPQFIAAAALLLAARKHAADHNHPIHLSEVMNSRGNPIPWYDSLDIRIPLADLEDCSAQIRDLYDGLFLSNQLGKTPDSGSGMPSTGSAGATPTPISPSPGVVQAVSPIMGPAVASGAPRREKDAKEGAPQAVVSQPSGSEARPGGTSTTEAPGERKPTGQASPPNLTPGASSADGVAVKTEDGKDKDAAAASATKEKERKEANREKRALKQEERNDRKFRPY